MKQTLQTLKEYQDVLVRIAELDNLLAYVPPEIVELEKEWKSIQKRLEELVSKKEETEGKAKEKENALAEAEIKAAKFERDLHEVTNSKEYHSVIKEIDLSKKAVHNLTEERDNRRKELTEIEINIEECNSLEKESQAKYESDLKAHEEQQVENRQERENLLKKRDKLAGKIPARLMTQFTRIASRRNGTGLAQCVNAICLGCNVRVRQNVVDQLRKYDRIHNCESCKRILYFADEEG